MTTAGTRILGYAGHTRLESKDYTVGASHTKDLLGSSLRRTLADRKSDLMAAFNSLAEENRGQYIRGSNLSSVWQEAGVGMRVSFEDRKQIAHLLTNTRTGEVRKSTFESFLAQHANFDVQPNSKKEAGNHIVGYSGHRRLSQTYGSVGCSSAKIVSAAVRQRLAGKSGCFRQVFDTMGLENDSSLQYSELKVGLQKMDCGLNSDQIKAIYREMLWKSTNKRIQIGDFCNWMDNLEAPTKTMNKTTTSPLISTQNSRKCLHPRTSICNGLASSHGYIKPQW